MFTNVKNRQNTKLHKNKQDLTVSTNYKLFRSWGLWPKATKEQGVTDIRADTGI